MKLALICFVLFLSIRISGQQFDGPNNFTDPIYRTGNVGIGTGTTAPIGKLQIYGNTVFSGSQGSFILTNAYQTGDHFIALAPNSGGTYQTNWDWSKALGFFGATGELQKSVTNNSDIAFSVVGASFQKNLKIYGDGRIVIGNVSAPSGYKLYVDDGILTEKIKISLSTSTEWMDSVFNSSYFLIPLDKLRNFISTNNRLPGFQSSQELYESGGLDLKETIIKQQQKIEELFLYILQLHDEIKHLQSDSKAER